MIETHATTILAVKKDGQVAMAGDGQVTLGQSMIMKHTARKVRRLYDGKIVAGFAGATADAFTLFELFEAKLKEFRGNLQRSAVELTKEWRKDKYLRRLEAMLLVSDGEHILLLSGNGDVFEPDDDVAAIGSGGPYALSAARALLRHPKILILDDSTSAVDTKTDAKIREGLATYLPDTTKLIIAHRISAVRHADEIIVLENGHIAERGTHEELLALHGLYYQTWQAQFGMMPDQKEVTDYGC